MAATAAPRGNPVPAAMFASCALMVHQVAADAASDALFLSHFPVTRLPLLMVGCAMLSIALVLASSNAMRRLGPWRLAPALFGASAALLTGIWWLSFSRPTVAAVALYAFSFVLEPVLISCFWSLISERFDPRTAKRHMGRIAGLGILGGVIGGVVSERVGSLLGVSAVIPVLAGLQLSAAVAARVIGAPEAEHAAAESEPANEGQQLLDGARVLTKVPYLRDLALLVLLGSVTAATLDYAFKGYAAERFTGGADLLRVFSIFYVVVSLAAFLVQTMLSAKLLERWGLARSVASLPILTGAGSLFAMAVPGFATVVLARGVEVVLRNSLFRSGYELLFAPIAPDDKRATKAIVDVGFENVGDLAGGALLAVTVFVMAAAAHIVALAIPVVLGVFGAVIAFRLHQGYLRTLEGSLVRGAAGMSPEAFAGDSAYTSLYAVPRIDFSQLREMRQLREGHAEGLSAIADAPRSEPASAVATEPLAIAPTVTEPSASPASAARDGAAPLSGASPALQVFIQNVLDLGSGDAARIGAVFARVPSVGTDLAPHIIPLLARDDLSEEVSRVLKASAGSIAGVLTDALVDPAQPEAVRVRIPHLLAEHPTERAIQGLFHGLSDKRFQVRGQCGRVLAGIRERDPGLVFSRAQVEAAVLAEMNVERRVWEGQRQLVQLAGGEGSVVVVDNYLRDRAHASLEHVFTLLSLILPLRPLRIAFGGLTMKNENLRGTSLEYLQSVLPPAIREKLWPFLDAGEPAAMTQRSREQILADLMVAAPSIAMTLAEYQKFADEMRRSESEGGTPRP